MEVYWDFGLTVDEAELLLYALPTDGTRLSKEEWKDLQAFRERLKKFVAKHV